MTSHGTSPNVLSPVQGSRRGFMVTLLGITLLSGCTLPNTCEIEDYAAFGGSWNRTVRDHGRVASVFDPAGAKSLALTDRGNLGDASEVDRNAVDDEDRESVEDLFNEDDPTSDDPNSTDEGGMGSSDKDTLEDVEDEKSRKLRNLDLDSIEVQYAPPMSEPISAVNFELPQ